MNDNSQNVPRNKKLHCSSSSPELVNLSFASQINSSENIDCVHPNTDFNSEQDNDELPEHLVGSAQLLSPIAASSSHNELLVSIKIFMKFV